MEGVDAKSLHFSGPKPHHHNPIQQYIDPLDELVIHSNYPPQVIVCDRGFSEVCFYEKFRRNITISEEWAMAAESYFSSKSEEMQVFMIKRPWEWSKPHHIEEINQLYPEATKYFISNQLMMRKAEHEAYYEYMENYLANKSLIEAEIIDLGIDEDAEINQSVINQCFPHF